MTNRPMFVRGLTLVAGCALLVGCSSSPSAQRDSHVRNNLTPELDTLTQRDIDTDNRQTLSIDENMRQANEDWYHFWLVDRPSRLSRYRMPR